MMQILLVDDESYVTESLKQTIPWGQLDIKQVYCASSALEAIDLLEAEAIDIVVTDIRMPEMTGLELIRIISERWPGVKSMLLTGYSDFEYAKQAIRLQAADYILKPVEDEEFMKSVASAVKELRDEQAAGEKYRQLQYSRQSGLQQLRTHFLHELLLGGQVAPRQLTEKLEEYEIELLPGGPAVLVLVQLGSRFSAMDLRSTELVEYAAGNIAEEMFTESFRLWSGQAPHGGLALVLQWREGAVERADAAADTGESGGVAVREGMKCPSAVNQALEKALLHQLARDYQQAASRYLNGIVYVTVSDWFAFAEGLSAAYRRCMGLRVISGQEVAGDGGVLMLDSHVPLPGLNVVKPLEVLHKTPSLLHLLESRQWDAARGKLDEALNRLAAVPLLPQEQVTEFFLTVSSAFMYAAHKQGLLVSSLDETGADLLVQARLLHSLPKLAEWTFGMLDKLQHGLLEGNTPPRSYIVKQVEEMIEADERHELSVKIIADRVYLHPVYLSKVYKAETGEGLGDYLIRKRMEKAAYLLKNSNKRIYEITSELGYQNPQYFSKMFRKHYGLTPNEYREQ